jgi:LemA protein
MSMMVVAIGVAVLIVLLIAWVVGTFNGLVRRRNQVRNAWSQIDVQLQRRHDLIPNLVETVKGFAAHERGVLESVTNARAAAIGATGPAQRAEAENVLTGALRSLFAVSEAYPTLTSNPSFISLQEELANSESKVAYARQYYNDAVTSYNNAIGTFPAVMLAGTLGFQQAQHFETRGDERDAVQVKF